VEPHWYNTLLTATRRWSIAFGALTGLTLLIIAAFLRPSTWVPDLTLTVGGSLVAIAFFAYIALPKDEFVERLWDQGVLNTFNNRSEDISDEQWFNLVKGAHRHYRVLGAGNHGYINSDKSREQFDWAFREAIEKNHADVEILWLNPQTDVAKRREEEEDVSVRYDACESMVWFYDLRQSLKVSDRHRLRLFEYERTPACGIVWADDRMVVTQYLPARANLFAPGLFLRKTEAARVRLRKRVDITPAPASRQLADVYVSAYNEVKGTAKEVDAKRVGELKVAMANFPHLRSEAVRRSEAQAKDKTS
jgi:hypothetical protein